MTELVTDFDPSKMHNGVVKIFEPYKASKPDFYPEATRQTEKFMKSLWNHFRFDFKRDIYDFNILEKNEQGIILRNLSAIGQVEINVKMYWVNIGKIFPHPAIINAGIVLGYTEVVHGMAYEGLLVNLGALDIFRENLKVPQIAGRIKYLTKHTEKIYENERQQQLYSLVLFSLFIENVSLFSQFYVMRWFNRFHPVHQNKNFLSETAVQIQYTRNEESGHAQFGVYLFNTAKEQYPEFVDEVFERRILDEAMEAYIAESSVIDWILDGYDQPKLSGDILRSFIQKRIDNSLMQIGFKPLFLEHPLRALDTEHSWFFDEEVAELDADNFDAHNDAYTKDDRSFNIDEDII